ncbi:energy transducer TonB [Mucilaginibacter ginkgonis]|uniref:TonB family protein n=1 Tax=Mucilaginibacter ginkgonis TaxID=2682091 RepID=A0A6I4HVM5_9SPHI|nr:energy transducer TonB [Mucilaginibacter ginkgonis]QQL50984.1 TonB family protein [Mucilaginibacter ginkgonis]
MLIPKFDLYKTEWLDLVFANRNKNYGAYELRNHYGRVMTKAIGCTVVGVVGAALIINIVTKRSTKDDAPVHTTVVDLTKVLQPPPAKPKPVIEHPPLASQSTARTVVIPTHVTSREDIPTDPPTLTEIEHAAVGAEASKGTSTNVNVPVDIPATGGGVGNATEAAPVDNTVHLLTDVAPEPFGGMAGWSRFLQKNMRYPNTDVEGRVILSFIVERDGSLSDVKVIKGIDNQLDAEALRVLKMAPKWKPGLQGNKPVRVQYTIPINFQLSN